MRYCRMAILSMKRKYPLGPHRWLWVVRDDRDDKVIFSVVQNGDESKLQERLKFTLTVGRAMDLAKFLANITTLDGFDDDSDTEAD